MSPPIPSQTAVVFFPPRDAVAQAEKMVREGADIIDIGGESTRPFSETVSRSRRDQTSYSGHRGPGAVVSKIPISIDTTKAAVARHALNAGASIVNDISALRADPALADVVATSGVPVILMHMKGTPGDMQVSPVYDDLFGEIYTFLEQAVTTAEEKGIQRSKIIIDPGIGFGKTVRHNLLLLKHLVQLQDNGLACFDWDLQKGFCAKTSEAGPPDGYRPTTAHRWKPAHRPRSPSLH